MKRKITVLLITVVCMAAFGALLHSPPSFMDAVTGATPRQQKTEQETPKLEGNYIFAINTSAEGLEDPAVRNRLKAAVSGGAAAESWKKEAAAASNGSSAVTFHIYVSDSDDALKTYARDLCSRLKKAGADVKVREYNDTMLRSRILSGRYQVFLAPEDLLDVTSLKQVDAVVLDSKEMRSTEG